MQHDNDNHLLDSYETLYLEYSLVGIQYVIFIPTNHLAWQ